MIQTPESHENSCAVQATHAQTDAHALDIRTQTPLVIHTQTHTQRDEHTLDIRIQTQTHTQTDADTGKKVDCVGLEHFLRLLAVLWLGTEKARDKFHLLACNFAK